MKTTIIFALLLFFCFGCSKAKPKTIIGTYSGTYQIKVQTEIYSTSETDEPLETTADTSYTLETEITMENNILHCFGYQLEIHTLEYGRAYYKLVDEETAISTLIFYEDVLSWQYEFHDCNEASHSTQTITYYGFKKD